MRCAAFTQLYHVFDFFQEHGVSGRADDCVLVASSKKPYFLLEWGKNTRSFDGCLALDGSMHKGHEVVVKVSQQQTAAEYRAKKPGALSLVAKREAQARQREGEAADAAANVVPISVLAMTAPRAPPNAAAAVAVAASPAQTPPQP